MTQRRAQWQGIAPYDTGYSPAHWRSTDSLSSTLPCQLTTNPHSSKEPKQTPPPSKKLGGPKTDVSDDAKVSITQRELSAGVWSTKPNTRTMNNTKASKPDVSVSNDTKVQRAQHRRFEQHEGAVSPTSTFQMTWRHRNSSTSRTTSPSSTPGMTKRSKPNTHKSNDDGAEDLTANVLTTEGWVSEQSHPALHHVFIYFNCPIYLDTNPIYLFIRTHTANLEMKTLRFTILSTVPKSRLCSWGTMPMVGMQSTNVQVLKTIYIIIKEGDSFIPCAALAHICQVYVTENGLLETREGFRQGEQEQTRNPGDSGSLNQLLYLKIAGKSWNATI